uniref:Uncharacterized protein n=1 Tax=Amphimedon queenslandica TaxID=400682 RepID=A0A1X7SVA3_AMPQE
MAKYTEESLVPATKEYVVLKKKASRLQTAITDPKLFSIDLLSENLISESTYQRVNAPVTTLDAQGYELINSLLKAVVIDPGNFHKLLEVLENHPPLLTAVAKEMKDYVHVYGALFALKYHLKALPTSY